MPWDVQQRDGQYCVVKKDGSVVKCHPKRDDAVSHMRALYANYEKELRNQVVKSFDTNTAIRFVETELQRGKSLLLPSIIELQVALETAEKNAPINEAEGNLEQAKLERENAASFREAIALLRGGKTLDVELEKKVRLAIKGGEGSGNFGHEGRPGLVGGSASGDGSSSNSLSDEDVRNHMAEFLGADDPSEISVNSIGIDLWEWSSISGSGANPEDERGEIVLDGNDLIITQGDGEQIGILKLRKK